MKGKGGIGSSDTGKTTATSSSGNKSSEIYKSGVARESGSKNEPAKVSWSSHTILFELNPVWLHWGLAGLFKTSLGK